MWHALIWRLRLSVELDALTFSENGSSPLPLWHSLATSIMSVSDCWRQQTDWTRVWRYDKTWPSNANQIRSTVCQLFKLGRRRGIPFPTSIQYKAIKTVHPEVYQNDQLYISFLRWAPWLFHQSKSIGEAEAFVYILLCQLNPPEKRSLPHPHSVISWSPKFWPIIERSGQNNYCAGVQIHNAFPAIHSGAYALRVEGGIRRILGYWEVLRSIFNLKRAVTDLGRSIWNCVNRFVVLSRLLHLCGTRLCRNITLYQTSLL